MKSIEERKMAFLQKAGMVTASATKEPGSQAASSMNQKIQNVRNIDSMNEEINLLRKEYERVTKEKNDIAKKLERTNELIISTLREKENVSKENRTLRISRIMAETGILTNSTDDIWTESPNKTRILADQESDKKILEKAPPEFVKNIISKRNEMSQETLKKVEEKKKVVYSLLSMSSNNYYPSLMLDNNKIILIELLGLGGFSSVWKAWDFGFSKFVAVKIIKVTSGNSIKQYATHLKREMDIMQSTNHKNVVKMYRFFFVDDDTVAYIIEYCEKGNLFEAIRDAGSISEKDAHSIIKQIIDGLLSLKSKPDDDSKSSEVVIHYDLKPANIVFDAEFTPKICDFGLSKIADEGKSILQSTAGSGTPGYTAPEAFLNYQKINFSADTWSLGIIFLEMLTGNFEVKTRIVRSDQSGIESILNSIFSSSCMKNVTKEAADFIKACLQREPTVRPTVKQLSHMPYISGPTNFHTKQKKGKSSK